MITKSELIEYLKHTPENTNYNILYSSLYNGSNKEAVDEFIEVLSRGNLSLAALQPYLAKLYGDDKTISPEPLPPLFIGGSPDAVLYTPQTLTDAQKQQARKNIEAASEFVVNGTINGEYGEYDESTATLDKTFAQIKEALSAGKVPTMRITGGTVGIDESSVPIYLHYASAIMETAELKYITFVGMITDDTVAELVVYADGNTRFTITELITIFNYDGMPVMPQQTMISNPAEDMEIATKKYVDDKISDKELILSSSTAGSTKKFKLTIDDTGTLTASEITA